MNPDEFFRSGAAADMILVVLALEFFVLASIRLKTGGGTSIADAFWRIAPGACLVVALRLALTCANWRWLALSLAAAGLCHLADAIRLAKRAVADQ